MELSIYREDILVTSNSSSFPRAVPPTFLPASSSDPTPGMRLKSIEVVVVGQHWDIREDEHLQEQMCPKCHEGTAQNEYWIGKDTHYLIKFI